MHIHAVWRSVEGIAVVKMKPLESLLVDLEHLRDEIRSCENPAMRALILFHHDCMSGSNCDACRITGRINDLVEQARMLNCSTCDGTGILPDVGTDSRPEVFCPECNAQ